MNMASLKLLIVSILSNAQLAYVSLYKVFMIIVRNVLVMLLMEKTELFCFCIFLLIISF